MLVDMADFFIKQNKKACRPFRSAGL